jgi:hypothetical protein
MNASDMYVSPRDVDEVEVVAFKGDRSDGYDPEGHHIYIAVHQHDPDKPILDASGHVTIEWTDVCRLSKIEARRLALWLFVHAAD